MTIERGSALGNYVVEEQIGQGGMGVVYRARDRRLGRDVALKIVSTPDFGGDGLSRFAQEARAASSLNHPNIVTIYDVGQDGATHFIAEELVVGRTLREWLAAGPLSIADAFDVSIQVAGALSEAHGAGIVHRDIKPENLMIRSDRLVKILDFGLAKVGQVSTDATTIASDPKTRAGVVMGTVSYMSPEQARGLAVDGRSDVFSLGVVLYEMVVGRAPFVAATPTDVLVAVLQQDPAPIERTPGVTAGLARIVAKALRKNADERYQTMRDLLADLKVERAAIDSKAGPAAGKSGRWTTIAIAAGILGLLLAGGALAVRGRFWSRPALLSSKDTILLTDFTNTTGDSMFDGGTLRQALMVQLQQTPFLNIFPDQATATTLAMMERTPDERITGAVAREICQRQHLTAMVSGAIAKLGQHYVLTIEATEPQSGKVVAAAQGEAPDVEHVLQVIGATAATLRERLGETVSTLQKYNTPIEQATTSSLQALKAYSEGQRFLLREDGAHALPFYLRAIELDPDFVAAYDNGAWAEAMTGRSAKAVEFATEAFRRRAKATELEQMSATATYHHFATGDWDQEIRLGDVWVRLFPNDWGPFTIYTLDDPAVGRLSEAPEAARAIIRLNRNIAQGYRFLVTALVPLQRYDEAEQVIKQARALGLDNVFIRRAELTMAIVRDDRAGVERALDAIATGNSVNEAKGWRARIAATEGRWRDARDLFEQLQPGSVELSATQALLGMCQPTATAAAFSLSRVVTPAASAAMIGSDGALCGDPAEAEAFAAELTRRFPASTVAREISLPQLRGAIALARHRPGAALDALRAIRAEGTTGAAASFYMRGYANLRDGRAGDAIKDFRVVVDHRAWTATSPIYPLAHLGLARAQTQSGDKEAARKTYQTLLMLWKQADADLPVYAAARAEAAALGREARLQRPYNPRESGRTQVHESTSISDR